MNKTEYGNYTKLIAFFLVAALLVVGFGFATEGWWQIDTEAKNDISAEEKGGNNSSGELNSSDDTPVLTDQTPVLPEYTNILTGLETTEELSRKRHFAFLLDPTSPLYGFYGSDIIAELPVESGETRLLVFTNDISRLSKLGSLTSTRSYISNIAKFLGAVIVVKGNDGTMSYESCDMSGSLFDMSENLGHYYTEYSQFTYTNYDLLYTGVSNSGINTSILTTLSVPYNFTDYGSSLYISGFNAKNVIIPYSSRSETELYYSSDTQNYSFNKNGTAKNDILSDKKTEFKNVFIIFADTLTYEASDSTEMVMNTIGKGSGFYITEGVGQNITWESDSSGNMIFYNTSGDKLTINRGASYIGFVKSSKSSDVKIS